MKKAFGFLIMVFGLIGAVSSQASSLTLMQRNLGSSSCFIADGYVGMAWKGELVETKSELQATTIFTGIDEVKVAIDQLTGASVVAKDPAEFHSLSPEGYFVVRGGQYLRLDSSTGAHQQLKEFIDLNCSPEIQKSAICRLECECWGVYSSYASPFFIRDVESWGYCPMNMSRKDIYQFHLKKAQQACRDAGRATSASKVLRSCKASF